MVHPYGPGMLGLDYRRRRSSPAADGNRLGRKLITLPSGFPARLSDGAATVGDMTDTLLLAGTRKGLLLARRQGGSWQTEPLALPMTAVYAVGIDARRATPRLFASATSEHWGPTILHSDDLGRAGASRTTPPVAFPKDLDAALEPGLADPAGAGNEPDVVYAGTEPAALFRSEDGGLNFELVRPLWEHPHRPQWGAGFGGQAIHTVIPHPVDPQRVLIALSSGGVYRTYDGGKSWAAAKRDQGDFPARGAALPRIRPVRSQGRPGRRGPGAAVPAEPQRRLPQR